MMPLHCQETATILLLILPTVLCLVPRLSIHHTQPFRTHRFRKIARGGTVGKTAATRSAPRLALGLDPIDLVAQHGHLLQQHADPASALDALSSFTLAKADLVPNQSLAPLAGTIKASMDDDLLRVLPDLPAMPGGAPRSGNAFLADSWRALYDAPHQFAPRAPSWTAGGGYVGGDALVVPAREWDAAARYADLLGRLPAAATAYALVDFFLLNAEEDVAVAEFFDDEEEVEAMLAVETRVVLQRFAGLLMVTAVTVAWSFLTYHPVPFSEL